MTDEEKQKIREVCERAAKIVESWPVWKRGILESMSKPTVSVPRKPICHSDDY